MLKKLVAATEIVAVVGFVVLVALLLLKQPTKNLTALPARTTVPAGQTGTTGTTAPASGAQLYKSNCAGCHGGSGDGGIGPQLSGGRVTGAFGDAASEIAFVKRGASGMPAFDGQLSDAELQAVIDFTRTELQK